MNMTILDALRELNKIEEANVCPDCGKEVCECDSNTLTETKKKTSFKTIFPAGNPAKNMAEFNKGFVGSATSAPGDTGMGVEAGGGGAEGCCEDLEDDNFDDNDPYFWDGTVTVKEIMDNSSLNEEEAEKVCDEIWGSDIYTSGYYTKEDFLNNFDFEELLGDIEDTSYVDDTEELDEGVFDTYEPSDPHHKRPVKKLYRKFIDKNGQVWIADSTDIVFNFCTIRKEAPADCNHVRFNSMERGFDTKQSFLDFVRKHGLEPINKSSNIEDPEIR